MHLSLLGDARPWGCRRGCCHLFARPLTFECMDLEDLQQIAATVQVKTSWLAAWWYASIVAWWRQTMRLQARLLPSVCKTFDIWMYGSWGFATDCGNRAGEDCWLAAWWYASCVTWWRQTMRLQARLLPSVCKTFDIWMYGSWGFATDCGNRAGED